MHAPETLSFENQNFDKKVESQNQSCPLIFFYIIEQGQATVAYP